MPNNNRGLAVHRTEDNFRTALMLIRIICFVVLVTIAVMLLLLFLLLLS